MPVRGSHKELYFSWVIGKAGGSPYFHSIRKIKWRSLPSGPGPGGKMPGRLTVY